MPTITGWHPWECIVTNTVSYLPDVNTVCRAERPRPVQISLDGDAPASPRRVYCSRCDCAHIRDGSKCAKRTVTTIDRTGDCGYFIRRSNSD